MWVHSNIVKSQQWMTVTSKKSKGKVKASFGNVVSISTREIEADVASLTCSGDEEFALIANTSTPPIPKTRSDKQYLKQYGQLVANSSQPGKEIAERFTKQPVDKQKELRYAKVLQKNDARPLTPFRFDVLS